MHAAEKTIDSRIIVIEVSLEGEQTLVGLRTDKVYEVTTFSKVRQRGAAQRRDAVATRLHQLPDQARGRVVIMPN